MKNIKNNNNSHEYQYQGMNIHINRSIYHIYTGLYTTYKLRIIIFLDYFSWQDMVHILTCTLF